MTKTQEQRSLHQTAARSSWMLPIIVVVLGFIGNHSLKEVNDPTSHLVIGLILVFLLIVGLLLGIIGCFGLNKNGARTTLVPGIVGILLNGTMLAIILIAAVAAYNKAIETHQNTQPLSNYEENQ